MVLQRGMPVPVWGTADPGEEISVKFRGQTKSTKADAQGKWLVKLDALQAGGPDELQIGTTRLSDVLVGEVWIGSGQSNMAMGTGGAIKNDPELAKMAAESYPTIRIGSATGAWRVAISSKGSIAAPALPLAYAIRLQEALNVPVGMIVGCVPGSSTTYWLTPDHLQADPACQAGIQRYATEVLPGLKDRYAKALADWQKSRKASDPKTKPAAPAEPGMPKLAHHVTGKFFDQHIRPAIPFAIRGILWDQGENTCSIDGPNQTEIMHALIQGWRKDWGQGELPWVFVQKPSAGGCAFNPDDPLNRGALPFAPLPEKTPGLRDGIYREFFLKILKTTPVTAMAICSDLSPGLHPPMKSSYATRAADAAMVLAYGQQLPINGPTYSGQQVEANKVVLRFENTGKGLAFRGGDKLQGFMVAGSDRKFVWAEAVIDGNNVVVSSPAVTEPESVRYAWADKHPWANLFNQDGLPAQSFRTDHW
jgi:sialate O-acetylesterase